MTNSAISQATLHNTPPDVKKLLTSESGLLEKWNSLTPSARNEWICWITIVKKEETRKAHIERLLSDLKKGKKRPCCWPGCPHVHQKAKKWFAQ